MCYDEQLVDLICSEFLTYIFFENSLLIHQMNFLDYIEHCHKNNMQPAEVLSGEENNVLTAYLDGNFG